jgi:hypothetical protein
MGHATLSLPVRLLWSSATGAPALVAPRGGLGCAGIDGIFLAAHAAASETILASLPGFCATCCAGTVLILRFHAYEANRSTLWPSCLGLIPFLR